MKLIIRKLKAKVAIPRNSRGEKKEGFYFQKNKVYCPADIAMLRKGKMTVAGITYLVDLPRHKNSEYLRFVYH